MVRPVAHAALLAACALAAVTARAADVYTWVDQHGTVHFQEAPPARERAKRVVLPDAAPSAQPPAATPAARSPAPAPAAVAEAPRRPPAVELFTTSWCPACRKAREYFTQRGIPFTEHDIEKDAAAGRRRAAIDGRKTIPVALIGDEVVSGFAPAAYERALRRR
jgi:glutaredoxin